MSKNHGRLVVRWGGQETLLEESYPLQKENREAAVGLAAICLGDYMERKSRPEGLDPQPWLLMMVRAIGELRNDGKRDKPFEDAVLKALIQNFGVCGIGALFGVEATA